ncbi:hypothetical protein PR048_013602 [Dryococelus australis]|uniref:Uncharacterized protein n=1 Tax=Dryococelus australis TaxID=614101 RepID=A0ABQ9HSM2_9NEOP|nr:hypothetical protein PR048_013602 [Dryococelus australis]
MTAAVVLVEARIHVDGANTEHRYEAILRKKRRGNRQGKWKGGHVGMEKVTGKENGRGGVSAWKKFLIRSTGKVFNDTTIEEGGSTPTPSWAWLVESENEKRMLTSKGRMHACTADGIYNCLTCCETCHLLEIDAAAYCCRSFLDRLGWAAVTTVIITGPVQFVTAAWYLENMLVDAIHINVLNFYEILAISARKEEERAQTPSASSSTSPMHDLPSRAVDGDKRGGEESIGQEVVVLPYRWYVKLQTLSLSRCPRRRNAEVKASIICLEQPVVVGGSGKGALEVHVQGGNVKVKVHLCHRSEVRLLLVCLSDTTDKVSSDMENGVIRVYCVTGKELEEDLELLSTCQLYSNISFVEPSVACIPSIVNKRPTAALAVFVSNNCLSGMQADKIISSFMQICAWLRSGTEEIWVALNIEVMRVDKGKANQLGRELLALRHSTFGDSCEHYFTNNSTTCSARPHVTHRNTTMECDFELKMLYQHSDLAFSNLVDCFGIIQEIFNFSSSTHRWSILVKPLSNTRWESRIEALLPLRYHIKGIYDAVYKVSQGMKIDSLGRNTALGIAKKLQSFKFLCCLVTWYKILFKINMRILDQKKASITSSRMQKKLQKKSVLLPSLKRKPKFVQGKYKRISPMRLKMNLFRLENVI